jgi:hypothetical protein
MLQLLRANHHDFIFDFFSQVSLRSQPQYVRKGFFGQLPSFDSFRNLSTLLVVATKPFHIDF